ncbi:hypothetical protein Z043_110465 [Scleropages formosus]|uniref:Uncharacterized protein n=1 Tax=Scleropages formosus TaxID=113540 RepID=A0A0P7VBY8_SCLFO|nr:hypothetical protein Z043_110465 [Scleropages formosus]
MDWRPIQSVTPSALHPAIPDYPPDHCNIDHDEQLTTGRHRVMKAGDTKRLSGMLYLRVIKVPIQTKPGKIDSNMTGNISELQADLSLNGTATLDSSNQAVNDALHEFKVFNITITSLALCILTFSSLFCSISCHRRRCKRRRAREYKSMVGCDQHGDEGTVGEARKNPSLRSPFSLLPWPQQRAADRAHIFFIYNNPVHAEDNSGKKSTLQGDHSELQAAHTPLETQRDTSDGVILSPAMFYMQL